MRKRIFHRKKNVENQTGMVFERDGDSYFCELKANTPAAEIVYALLTSNAYERSILFNLEKEEAYGYGTTPVPDMKTFAKKLAGMRHYLVRAYKPGSPEIEICFEQSEELLQVMFYMNGVIISNDALCEVLLKELYIEAKKICCDESKNFTLNVIYEQPERE